MASGGLATGTVLGFRVSGCDFRKCHENGSSRKGLRPRGACVAVHPAGGYSTTSENGSSRNGPRTRRGLWERSRDPRKSHGGGLLYIRTCFPVGGGLLYGRASLCVWGGLLYGRASLCVRAEVSYMDVLPCVCGEVSYMDVLPRVGRSPIWTCFPHCVYCFSLRAT